MSGSNNLSEVLDDMIIASTFLEHTNGTKAYESTSLVSEKHLKSIIINRYGSIRGMKKGGGKRTYKILNGSQFAENYRAKVIESKRERGYTIEPTYIDLNRGQTSRSKAVFLSSIGVILDDNTLDDNTQLQTFFESCGLNAEPTHIEDIEEVISEPEKVIQINRGASWGSW